MNIICAGECMLELSFLNRNHQPKYSGDAINFGIYLKRISPLSNVRFFSSVGYDRLSNDMIAYLKRESIDTQLVFRTRNKTVGLYMIDTDSMGERTFNYWRSDSAAKRLITSSDKEVLKQALRKANYFYFSGITLAILNKQSKSKLLAMAENIRAEGKNVIFDPNFRPTLWRNQNEAKAFTQKAYSIANIILSSSNDEKALFDLSSTEEIKKHLASYPASEIVLTSGQDNILILYQDNWTEVKPQKAKEVVDTTSAGDAFNAGYLAARDSGLPPVEAVRQGSSLAAKVVASEGAIISLTDMK